MALTRGLLSAHFFCEHCQREARFLTIHFAVNLTGVSRRTIYNWMEKDLVHWRQLPSGRRLICEQSLSHPSTSSSILSIQHKSGVKLSSSMQS